MKRIGSLLALFTMVAGCAANADPASTDSTGSTQQAVESGDDHGALIHYGDAEDFLESKARPIVFGHEGAGENFGADTSKPINDTVASVSLAYDQGAAIVEVDTELTKDGYAVAYHDFDFLPDYSCINSYTLAELQAKLPYVPTLEQVLDVARDRHGLMIIELKTPSPLCDPGDSTEQALVSRVVQAIDTERMGEKVIFDGFSPALLYIAKQLAPRIPRELDMDLLQLMKPAQVQANTGLTVTQITKADGLGLQWADVGPIYRLPGYTSVSQFFWAAKAVDAALVGVEQDFIGYSEQSQPGSVAQFVGAAHALGFKAVADPAKTAAEFAGFAAFGFDAAYCDDIPGSLALQPKR